MSSDGIGNVNSVSIPGLTSSRSFILMLTTFLLQPQNKTLFNSVLSGAAGRRGLPWFSCLGPSGCNTLRRIGKCQRAAAVPPATDPHDVNDLAVSAPAFQTKTPGNCTGRLMKPSQLPLSLSLALQQKSREMSQNHTNNK